VSADTHLFWLASRGTGIVAFALLTAAVSLGLIVSARDKSRPGMAALLRGLHEHLALAGLVAIGTHGALLLGDPFLRASVLDVTTGFTMAHEPLWVGLGALAGWLTLVLVGAAYLKTKLKGPWWKRAHRFLLLAWGLAVAHTLGAGTDVATTWMRAILVLGAAPLAYGLALRLTPRSLTTWPRTSAPPSPPKATPTAASSASAAPSATS
jgi:sulfoxide reductase heme-binding subunit YedZ